MFDFINDRTEQRHDHFMSIVDNHLHEPDDHHLIPSPPPSVCNDGNSSDIMSLNDRETSFLWTIYFLSRFSSQYCFSVYFGLGTPKHSFK